MAIKPGLGRKSSSKNPPILSHEFVIQNHADIVASVAMIFVVGLTVQATTHIANAFIALSHNVTGGEPGDHLTTYTSGFKDYFAIFFYSLICIIMHAVLQEYVLDKISKKFHLTKSKLLLFNDVGQLVVFYVLSLVWGIDVVFKEGYLSKFSLLLDDFPQHPMTFLHKLFFIIQLAYYLHMLPELYFQRIKKEDQQSKIIHAISGFSVIALAYFLGFQRIALVLIVLHYISEAISYTFQIMGVFDKDEKLGSLRFVNSVIFIFVRFTTVVISILTLYFGLGGTEYSSRGLALLFGIFVLQGYMIFSFITEQLHASREKKRELQKSSQTKKSKSSTSGQLKEKSKKKKESDLPEADQPPSPVRQGKLKSK